VARSAERVLNLNNIANLKQNLKKNLVNETGGPNKVHLWTKPEDKNLTLLSLEHEIKLTMAMLDDTGTTEKRVGIHIASSMLRNLHHNHICKLPENKCKMIIGEKNLYIF
jgi:hypothetical protein